MVFLKLISEMTDEELLIELRRQDARDARRYGYIQNLRNVAIERGLIKGDGD